MDSTHGRKLMEYVANVSEECNVSLRRRDTVQGFSPNAGPSKRVLSIEGEAAPVFQVRFRILLRVWAGGGSRKQLCITFVAHDRP